MKTMTGLLLTAAVLVALALFVARHSLSPVAVGTAAGPAQATNLAAFNAAHALANTESSSDSEKTGQKQITLAAVPYPQAALDLPSASASRPVVVTDANGQKQMALAVVADVSGQDPKKSALMGVRYPAVALDR